MKGLLIRVAADQSEGDGSWNGPVDSRTGGFVYVAIPESSPTHQALNKAYAASHASLGGVGVVLPGRLVARLAGDGEASVRAPARQAVDEVRLKRGQSGCRIGPPPQILLLERGPREPRREAFGSDTFGSV